MPTPHSAARTGTPAERFAQDHARHARVWLIALQTLRTTLRLALAGVLAVLAGGAIFEGTLSLAVFGAALGVAGLLAVAGYGAGAVAANGEARTASAVVQRLGEASASLPARQLLAMDRGALVSSAGRHPGALARLVVSHKVARTMLAVGPLLAVIAIVPVSWQAALVLLCAGPLMVLFLALIGRTIGARARAQDEALGRLAAQFADRARALPTILANHATARETRKLRARMSAYARGTMGVLAVAFLNSAVLDFFSALSIATLAVFLGLGHLGLASVPGFDGLSLTQSLYILLVAPEFFAPFRRYAEQYHAKAEGVAAADALRWAFEAERAPARSIAPLGMRGLVLPHVGAVGDAALPARGLVAVTGASGAGKSTLLRVLAGVEPPVAGEAGLGDAPSDYVAVDSHVPAGTLAGAIGRTRSAPPAAVTAAAARLGLLDDALLPGGLNATIAPGGENLSGGQRVRLAVARMLLGDGPALCDEPTAKLDHANAERVCDALSDAARRRLVVVATHDARLIERADRVIRLRETAPNASSNRTGCDTIMGEAHA